MLELTEKDNSSCILIIKNIFLLVEDVNIYFTINFRYIGYLIESSLHIHLFGVTSILTCLVLRVPEKSTIVIEGIMSPYIVNDVIIFKYNTIIKSKT